MEMKPFRITIHCSDSPDGVIYPLEQIRKMHIEEKGFTDIGYHAVIQPNGELEVGRGLNESGAHVQGENDGNVGICMVGRGAFTHVQFDTLRRFIDSLIQIYEIKPWQIFGHREFRSAQVQGKSCPNMDIKRLLAWYLGHSTEAVLPYVLEAKR
jgi:hypothetical protein